MEEVFPADGFSRSFFLRLFSSQASSYDIKGFLCYSDTKSMQVTLQLRQRAQ